MDFILKSILLNKGTQTQGCKFSFFRILILNEEIRCWGSHGSGFPFFPERITQTSATNLEARAAFPAHSKTVATSRGAPAARHPRSNKNNDRWCALVVKTGWETLPSEFILKYRKCITQVTQVILKQATQLDKGSEELSHQFTMAAISSIINMPSLSSSTFTTGYYHSKSISKWIGPQN